MELKQKRDIILRQLMTSLKKNDTQKKKIRILISNPVDYHYEIIESVLMKYRRIFNINIESNIQADFFLHIGPNIYFRNYIKSEYPYVQFKLIHDYDYLVYCTVYPHFKNINSNKYSNVKYISHRYTSKLKQNSNVFFLSPLSPVNVINANILPFSNETIKTNIPVYIVQGSLNDNRRHIPLLIKILENKYEYDFKIKLIGRGCLPQELYKYKEKIILKNNLNFIEYHKAFLDGYCVLPLVTENSHPQYYTTTLTSTINYAKAYRLKCLIDNKLQNIYNLQNVEIFFNINDVVDAFTKTLHSFYLK